jgi:hypothetical protein
VRRKKGGNQKDPAAKLTRRKEIPCTGKLKPPPVLFIRGEEAVN